MRCQGLLRIKDCRWWDWGWEGGWWGSRWIGMVCVLLFVHWSGHCFVHSVSMPLSVALIQGVNLAWIRGRCWDASLMLIGVHPLGGAPCRCTRCGEVCGGGGEREGNGGDEGDEGVTVDALAASGMW